MKRSIVLALGLVAVVTSESAATVRTGDGLLWFNGGYSLGTLVTGSDIDGVIASFAYEKLDWSVPVSFGVGVAYSALDEQRVEEGTIGGTRSVDTTVATIPFQVGAKYWLGQGGIQCYLGTSLGIYFSEVRRTVVETGSDFTSLGYAGGGMGVPVGLAVSLSETMLLSAGYTLNWMWSNEAFDDDLLHAFTLGVGFNLGR